MNLLPTIFYAQAEHIEASASAPQLVAPVVTFGMYIGIAQAQRLGDFTIDKAFTSLSLITLLSGSLASFIGYLPTFTASSGCFNRIQKFLSSTRPIDPRIIFDDALCHRDEYVPDEHMSETAFGVELMTIPRAARGNASGSTPRMCFEVDNGYFGTKELGTPILRDINLRVPHGNFTIITGTVGCGKSTLLRALLGEIPCSAGSIRSTAGKIGYCDQESWLCNVSIRRNIIGESDFDPRWYSTVVQACALNQDFESLPGGDSSVVGSDGLTLSGGQRQRIVGSSSYCY